MRTEIAADVVVLSVKLESGQFEASMRLPVNASVKDMIDRVTDWCALIHTAIKTGVEQMEANLGNKAHD